LGTFREHSGNIQGTCREHSGNIQGTFREHSGNMQDNKPLMEALSKLIDLNRPDLVSESVQPTFKKVSIKFQKSFKKFQKSSK
jgi:hypothetical protein